MIVVTVAATAFLWLFFGNTAWIKLTWNTYSDGLFTVYYPDNSVIKDDVPGWLARRQDAFEKNCEFLGVDWNYGPITFFVFNDSKQGLEYGYKLGFARPRDNVIFTRHNQTTGHELTHLITYRINEGKQIRSGVIREGIAVYLDRSRRNVHAMSYKLHNSTDRKITSGDLSKRNFYHFENSYPLAGSFVKYLIETYGIEKFKALYAQSTYWEAEAFDRFYGKSFDQLFDEWVGFLNDKKWRKP